MFKGDKVYIKNKRDKVYIKNLKEIRCILNVLVE